MGTLGSKKGGIVTIRAAMINVLFHCVKCNLFNRHGKLLLKRRRGDIDVMPIVTSINDLILVTYFLADVVLGSLAYNSSGGKSCQ